MTDASRARKHVRTGCLNCKTRHLKCGEEKPSCKQCILGRWTCEYITPAPPVRRKSRAQYALAWSVASTFRPKIAAFVGPRERSSFDFFQSAASNSMSGYSCGESWWRLALRTSHHEPAVRHAVYALGSLLSMWATEQDNNAPQSAFALTHYNESIRSCINGLASDQESHQTTLVLCLLFISIELLQNNIDLALHHLRGGLRIATGLKSDMRGDRLDTCLSHAFIRFEAQARIHSSPTSDFNHSVLDTQLVVIDETPKAFFDVNNARIQLEYISTSTYSVLRRIKHLTRSGKLDLTSTLTPAEILSLKHKFTTLGKRLSRWWEAFTILRKNLPVHPSHDETAAFCLLELHYTTQVIVLRNVYDPGEMCYDECTPEFSRIINLVRNFMNTKADLGLVPVSLDSGLIAPLFLVAMKCRVPALRIAAIELLRLCPRREGLWHRDSTLQVAQWKFFREGKDCVEMMQHGTIPESARIHSERTEGCIVDGVAMLRRRFKQGLAPEERIEVWRGQVSSLTAAMGDML